jgi:hypothetical protein
MTQMCQCRGVLLLIVLVGILCAPSPAAAQLPSSCTQFTNNPLLAGTVIKAVHIMQLRACVNALRSRVNLPSVPWTDPILVAGVTPMKAVHITELRSAVNAVYIAKGQTAPTYTDPTLGSGTVVKTAHITDLRASAVAAPAGCSYTVSPQTLSVDSSTNNYWISVSAPGADCGWTTNETVSWFDVGTYTGSAFRIDVENNTSTQSRSGSIDVAGSQVTVTQAGVSGCPISFSSTEYETPADQSTNVLDVFAPSGCSWSATSNSSFIQIVGGGTGSGNGIVTYATAANTDSSPRVGALAVNGRTVQVTQFPAQACTLTTEMFPNANGDGGTITITAPSWCQWTITPEESWILVSTPIGQGSGSTDFTIDTAAQPDPEFHATYLSPMTVATSPGTGLNCYYPCDPEKPLCRAMGICLVPGLGGGAGQTTPTQQYSCVLPVVNKKGFQPAALPFTTKLVPYVFAGVNWTADEKKCVGTAITQWNATNQISGLGISLQLPRATDSIQVYFYKQPPPNTPDAAGGATRLPLDFTLFATSANIYLTTDTQKLQSCAGFTKVALHEIGHTMGLQDNPSGAPARSSVMNQPLSGKDDKGNYLSNYPTSCDRQKAFDAQFFP